jgi:nitrogen regulatory protein PII
VGSGCPFPAFRPIFVQALPPKLATARKLLARRSQCRSVRLSACEERMKLIVAVIKPFKLEEVREALTGTGVQGLMVSEVKGYGRQSGHTEIYRGAEYVVNFVPKVKLELVVPDAAAPAVVEALAGAAKTGKIGDGKIFVLDVEQALRVRTGETGDDAL